MTTMDHPQDTTPGPERLALLLESAASLGPDTYWRDRAACGGRVGVMFPESSDAEGVSFAKLVCASCPVAPRCLAEAMAAEGGEPVKTRHGVAGGAMPRERWDLYRHLTGASSPARTGGGRSPAPCETQAAYDRHKRRKEECEACTEWKSAAVAAARTSQGSGTAKLNETLVVEIRTLAEQGMARSHLAAKYKVNKATIQRILRRETWTHC